MITVLKPGLLTTIQDAGRAGHRASGMPIAGALDGEAYAAANLLAGNPAGLAAIEQTLLGGTFRFDEEAFVGIAGADLQARLDDVPVASWSCLPVPAGATLTFAGARSGVRGYLAVRGGIDVPPVLGSRATYTRARVGGLQGRALAKGDALRIGSVATSASGLRASAPAAASQGGGSARREVPAALIPSYGREVRLRVLLGPQDDRFDGASIEIFLGSAYTVSNRNDRMGYLLDGPSLRHTRGADIVSDGIVPGSVQVPGSGRPIVMMADCATVGGYTKIATVISADLHRLAQARAGDQVRFERCTYPDGVAALRERGAWLDALGAWARAFGDTQGGCSR